MKKLFLFTIAVIALLNVKAQQPQVPMDEEGNVEFIDSKQEKKIELFSEYKKFKEARLFQNSDTLFTLNILYQPNSKLLISSKLLSQSQVNDLRKKVSIAMTNHVNGIGLNQEGRTKLLISSSVISIGFYGAAVPSWLNIDNNKTFVGLYMLTSGAGFYIPYTITKNITITDADANMFIYGQTRGIAAGILFSYILNNDASEQAVNGWGILTSVAGGIGGYKWAENKKMSSGVVSTINAMGDFGAGIGMGTAHVLGFLDNYSTRKIAISAITGTAAGLYSGVLLSKNQEYTRGDAFVLRGTGVLGAYTSLALAIIADPDSEKVYTGMATLGGLTGIAIGNLLAKRFNFTTKQGILINLGELAGGMIGMGTGYLLSSDNSDMPKVLTSTSAIGAIAGFALMTKIYTKKAYVKDKNISLNFNFNPQGLLELASNKKQTINQLAIPIFNAQLRF